MERVALRRRALPLKRRFGVPVASVVEFLLRQTARRAGVVLMYHRVGDPQGDPARELVPQLGTRLFEAQLRHLRTRYVVVPPSEILQAAMARRRGDRFPVAITFDDDLPSHVRVAAPILERVGVSAGFFLCGASLDAAHAFWWERLQAAVERDALEPGRLATVARSVVGESIHDLATAIEGLPRPDREAVAAVLRSEVGPDPDDSGLRADDVHTLGAGFEVGFHTLRHESLPPLTDEELTRALTDGRAALADLIGRNLTTIAYPYGYADDRVARKAREAGYALGFTCRREPVTTSTDALLIGRLEPSFSSLGDFALHVIRTLTKRSHR